MAPLFMGKLTTLAIKHLKPGMHADGDDLYLRVKPTGGRSWVLRVMVDGKRRDFGLGSLADVKLTEARDKATHYRKLARQRKDVIVERDRAERGPIRVPTFAEAVDEAHKELSKGWAPKTGEQFKASMRDHAVPVIGKLPVDQVGTDNVIAVLAKIWTERPQQARKVRHRVLQVLAFAKSRGWRSDPVPLAAELRRGLSKQPRSQGFAAMPFREVPAFVSGELGKADTSARLAMLFAILTAARSGEVRQARWQDINRAARTWSKPAEHMKSGLAHVVTLNAAALAVLDRAAAISNGRDLIFPALRADKPLSDMTLGKVLRAAGRSETVHGFRSSFRDWAAERMPTLPAMVAEMALAHTVGTATERAYLRSDLLELRFQLMDAWGEYVGAGK